MTTTINSEAENKKQQFQDYSKSFENHLLQQEVQQAMLVVADEIINFEANYEAKTVFQLDDGINKNGKLKQVYRDLRAQQS